MAKRKREDWNGSDVDVIVDKKPRRDHRTSQRSETSSAPAGNLKGGAVPTPTTNPKQPSPSKSKPEVLEAPPGLNKNQRKRWRKKQQRLANRASSGGSGRPQSKSAQSQAQNRSRTSVATQSSNQSAKSVSQNPILKASAVTYLMPRRQKEWHQEAQTAKVTNFEKDSSEHVILEEGDPIDRSEGETSSHDEHEQSASSKSKTSTSDHGDEATTSTSSGSSSGSIDSAAEESSPQTHAQLQNENQSATTSQPTDKARSSTAPIEPPSSTTHLTVRSTGSIRRSSFGNRATSVPFFSTNTDPISAFKRFSAFLHKNDSSSDDEDSGDSDSEVSVNALHISTSKGAGELIVQVAAGPKAKISDKNKLDDTQPSSELERVKSNEEDKSDELPRFADAISQPVSTNGSSWPANVGIKRQLSFLGHEPGGTPSGSTADPQCETEPHPLPIAANQSDLFEFDRFDVNDDSQELLRTVDEISNSVFGSTRPLPAIKDTLDSGTAAAAAVAGAGNERQENGVLTSASSDRRMTRSTSTPKKTQERHRQNDDVPASSSVLNSDEVVRYQQSVPKNMANRPIPDGNEEASEFMSDNIDVAIPGTTGSGSDLLHSSCSLSELSRSPSPPANAASPTTPIQPENKPASDPRPDDRDSAIGITSTEAVPRKKCKMTGRTSKHFTPQKRAAGKRSATTQKPEPDRADAQAEPVKLEPPQTHIPQSPPITPSTSPEKSVRRTRASSKAEKYETTETKVENSDDVAASHLAKDTRQPQQEGPPPAHSTRSSTKKRKSTGKRSTYFTPTKPTPTLDPAIIDRVDFYNTTSSTKKARVSAGTSTAPVPPITAPRFGIIQEKLWQEPFWLLIAVTFLNKTTGRAAVPVFWTLKERYATPEALADADQAELCEMIQHLGLQNQRSKRMISMAQAWVEQSPVKGKRGRTMHYPAKGDGVEFKRGQVLEEDADDCAGALEIAHIPGCGPYAWDSWRIFCRDVLRGVAGDYDGAGAEDDGFVPEWKKVIPSDKELRACLRWMWLREGWIWNHESGEKRRATEEEMARAFEGEMEIDDPTERKFAAQAAGVEVSPFKVGEGVKVEEGEKGESTPVYDLRSQVEDTPALRKEQLKTPEPHVEEDEESDNIVVTPVVSPGNRRTRRSSRLSV